MRLETMTNERVKAWVDGLKEAGYKVMEFTMGACVEIDGLMIFRATAQTGDRYEVKYNEEIFRDV